MDLIRAFSSTAIGFGHYIFLHSVSFMYLFLFYFYWVVQSSLKNFLNFYVLVIPLRCCILITTILNKCRHPILYFSFDLGIKNSLFYMIGPFQLCFSFLADSSLLFRINWSVLWGLKIQSVFMCPWKKVLLLIISIQSLLFIQFTFLFMCLSVSYSY